MTYKICVVGSEAFLLPFFQFGLDTFTPADASALRAFLREMPGQGYGILYIEDSFCPEVRELLAEFRDKALPIVIPIGGSTDGESYADGVMKEIMEKAAGIRLPDTPSGVAQGAAQLHDKAR